MTTGIQMAALATLKSLLPMLIKTPEAEASVKEAVAIVTTFDARLKVYEAQQVEMLALLRESVGEARTAKLIAEGYNEEQRTFLLDKPLSDREPIRFDLDKAS